MSGADLALLLVESLVTSGATNYVEWIPKLCKIFAKISPSTPERDTFLANSIRWTAKSGRQGHPFLHQVCELQLQSIRKKTRIMFFLLIDNAVGT